MLGMKLTNQKEKKKMDFGERIDESESSGEARGVINDPLGCPSTSGFVAREGEEEEDWNADRRKPKRNHEIRTQTDGGRVGDEGEKKEELAENWNPLNGIGFPPQAEIHRLIFL